MLDLKNVYKSYKDEKVLKNINIFFRNKEFVSILGPSGSGKTTLLNIIGGLDTYDSGDLIINGKSTKTFKSKDWDSYRNKKIGFIFQNYNLINHLSVYDNVKISLTLSGLSKNIIKKKTVEALTKVGLVKHIYKKPNQLSGGQMQRVAIARAIVNNPDIIVADEPTGALDSKTSINVMNILKEISKERLVIMVTHNKDLAIKYSDRIIEIEDGCIKNDSSPFNDVTSEKEIIKRKKSMSIITSLKLSFLNLLTKKKRTFLTSLAGSIGIVGIALVLSINSGVNNYIKNFEKESISEYPIEINKVDYDLFEDIQNSISSNNYTKCDKNKICINDDDKNSLYENNLIEFKKYIDNNSKFKDYSSNIIYDYDVDINIYNESYQKINNDMLKQINHVHNYKLIYGKEPTDFNEIAILVNNNYISKELFSYLRIENKKNIDCKDIIGRTLKLVLYTDYFSKDKNVYVNHELDNKFMRKVIDNAVKLKIVGIYDSNEVDSSILYTSNFIYYVINSVNNTSMYVDKKLDKYDINNPSSIQIYPKDYKSKKHIINLIKEYNKSQSKENTIKYTDLMKSFISGISKLLNLISYILIAFVAISLIVSSIMISIITYISVLERTKEIGILRAIGASKKDIKRIFISETMIEGICSGLLGIIITVIISNVGNMVIYKITNIQNLVIFSYKYMFILLLLSITLSIISGRRATKLASKKNPVDSLKAQ